MRTLLFALLLTAPTAAAADDWVFRQGWFTHDRNTGRRVEQYAAKYHPPAFPDARFVSSGYVLTRVNQLGADGSTSIHYRVENWSNGRGGIDAEWERVNDVWQRSVLQGGFGVGRFPNYGYGGLPGYGFPGYGFPGYGNPGGGYPGFGYPPGVAPLRAVP